MDRDITEALAAAARAIGHTTTVDEALATIVHTARMSLPGFEHVGISTIDRHGTIETRAQTSDLVVHLDDLQYRLGEGPCVETLRQAVIVQAPCIRNDSRWPRYVPAAVELGLKSQLALQLYVDEDDTLGGLNIYSTTSEDIDDDAVSAADVFAAQAAVALGRVRKLEQLGQALSTREIIGEALGLIMGEYDVTREAAFAFLARTSSHTNIKVRDLAERMVVEHEQRVRSERPPHA